MYIEKKYIGGLKYCEDCPYFKLKTDSCLYADSDELRGIIVKCEHHDICYRIDLKVCEEKLKNDIKKEGE